MAKLKRFVLIPLFGGALALSLAAVAACGGGKKAKVTLDAGDGGSLKKTEYSVRVGADLSDFLEDKTPSDLLKDLTFAGWYNGADLIEAGATMPEEGLSLTAKYTTGYTLNVYKWDETTSDYGKPATTSHTAFWHEPLNILDVYPMPEGYELDDTKANVTSTDSLEPGDSFTLYVKPSTPVVTFRSNASDGVEIGGIMPSQTLKYGSAFTVPAPAFVAPENYRFAGWTKSGEDKRYFEGDIIANVTENFSLYANWERGYTDLGGGSDIIFFPGEEENVALLVREGLGEKRGTYDPATRIFTFTLDNSEKLIGRVTAWNAYTFSYEQDREEVPYTYRDAFTETGEADITLTLDTFDGATFTDPAGKIFADFKGTTEGVWSLYGTLGGEDLYAFLSEKVNFLFKLGDEEDVFYISDGYAGSYSLITEEGSIDDYYVLELDGFGKAYYEVYSDMLGWTTEEGSYELLGNGECEVTVGDGDPFKCMLVKIGPSTYAFLRADSSLEDTFTSADKKTTIEVDGYGDLGYATVTEDGKSTTYAKYWDVFSITVGDKTTLYRYLRCIDEATGEILRTFLFEDGSEDDKTFTEVGVEAGQYFAFDLTTSSIDLFFLTFDGKATQKALGAWTLYSFTADGDVTIATRLAGGAYDFKSGSYILTLEGAAAEGAPAAFKTSPVSVITSEVTSGTTVLGVFVVDNEENKMTMYAADGSNAKIEIDGYGLAYYTDAGGVTHYGTVSASEYDEDPPVEGGDKDKDCILGFKESQTGDLYYFYLPNGLGNDNRFYPIGAEYGSYEGGTTDLYGTYLYLSGFAGTGEEGGYALFGSTSSAITGYIYVVQGVYTFEREEYFGTVWHFEGKVWNDNTNVPSDMRPTDIHFSFILDTMDVEGYAYPIYRAYNEEDEAEYTGPNGESLVVTGVRTARFTDAKGRVWTGDATRSEDTDWYGKHIADTVNFVYLGTDGYYYEFTFRIDDETGTFLIQGAEVGAYYAFDTEDMTVNGNLRLSLDGYGGATLYVPNSLAPDEPVAGDIRATGSYKEIGGGIFRFDPDKKYEKDYPAFTFECSAFTESESHGSAEYAVYVVYEVERKGNFINKDWSVLTVNGYDTAVYIDSRGRRLEGTFALLGESVVRLTAEGTNLYFQTDGEKGTFSIFEGEFIVEKGVLLAYTGTDTNVTIPKDQGIAKIGRGAFIDAKIETIDLGNVTEIGPRAFDGATMSTITGGDQVTRIEDQAFLYCDNLKTVDFPKATYVGAQAFAHCYLLESVTLGGEVTFIGDRAFESCLTDPESLTSVGTFKLVLGNKTTAPGLGGTGVFGIYYNGGIYKSDLDFTVRVVSLDALKAIFLDTKWQNGSKALVGETKVPVGDTFNNNVCFFEAGEEAGAWYATDTLDRVFLDGIATLNGQYFGAYELKDGTITFYSYKEGETDNFTTSEATMSEGTLTGAFGGTSRSFKHQGTTLTYTNQGQDGDLVITLREKFPLLATYKGQKALVTAEGGKAVFTLGGDRYEATLTASSTYTVTTKRAAFDEYIEGDNGSLRITMDEAGNVTMTNGTLDIDGQTIEFSKSTHCGQVEKDGQPVVNEYYLDTEIGAIEGKIVRIIITVTVEVDEEAFAYRYSFTYETQDYLTLTEVKDPKDASRSVVFGYDNKNELKDMWMRFTVANVQGGGERFYNVSGEWEPLEGNNGYRFYAVDGYDPVEGITYQIAVTKDEGGKITSVTIAEYLLEIEFEGSADDESHIKVVSKKDDKGNMSVTVEGTFKKVADKEFTAKATGKAEYISGNTFAVYTTKEIDEKQYYRILITIKPHGNTFTYKAERAGDIVGTEVTTDGESYTVWVYAPEKGSFNSNTWFFMQLEANANGQKILLDGTAVYANNYPHNAEFKVTTAGNYADRVYRLRIGVGLDVSDFNAL